MSLRNGQSNGSIRTWRRYFPLNCVDDVVNLMQEVVIDSGVQLSLLALHPPTTVSTEDFKYNELPLGDSVDIDGKSPNLAFVSTILGYIENHLTIPNQYPFSTRKCRNTVAAPSQVSPSPGNHACPKILIPPSPLSIRIDVEHSLQAVNSSADPSPLSTVSSTATPMPAHQQPSGRKGKRSRRFSSSSSNSQSRRLRHTSASNIYPIVDIGESTDSPASSLAATVDHGETSSKRRRFSETSLPTSNASPEADSFPRLTFDDVDRYYREFHNLIVTSPLVSVESICCVGNPCVCVSLSPLSKSCSFSSQLSPYAIDQNSTLTRWASRDLIGTVLQVLWNRMIGAGRGRDRQTHTQSVYSFLTTGLLDSFGLAYTIVAACQLLGYSDVDLALSEDHGWVEFGPSDDRQTADVASWVHQRQQQLLHQSQQHNQSDQQQLRLPSIREPPLTLSWLYVNGQPVVCRPRLVAMAAAVTAMQPGGHHDLLGPSLSPIRGPDTFPHNSSAPTAVSYHLVQLKHRLLWLLYSSGCLTRYPLALTNLADLEDTLPVIETYSGQKTRQAEGSGKTRTAWPIALYRQAVVVNQRYYDNQHVYPYTCLAGCLYRQKNYPEALSNWCAAARVIGQYKHSSEDLEVYRELLEIATHWMPQMFRLAAAEARSCSEGLEEADADGCIFQPDNILDSPQCLAHLISFYDHLCLWEESASVPVLHVGWVDKLMVNLGRFSPRARRHLHFDIVDTQSSTVVTPTASVESTTSWQPCHSVAPPSVRPLSTVTLNDKSQGSPVMPASIPAVQPGKQDSPKADDHPMSGDTGRILVDHLASSTGLDATDYVGDQQPASTADAAATTQVLLVPTDAQQASSQAEEDWHLLTSGVKPKLDVLSQPTVRVAAPKEDQDASPSPPPLLLFPGDDQLMMVNDTEELLSSLAEACDRHLLNPAFLAGVEPNAAPFLSADCKIDEVFERLFASLGAGRDTDQSSGSPMELVESSPSGLPDVSIFPTPPVSSGVTMAESLSSQQQKLSSGEMEKVPVSDQALQTVEEVVGLQMFKVLFDSVATSSQSQLLAAHDDEKRLHARIETTDLEKPTTPQLSLGENPIDPSVHLSLRSTKMVSIVELLRATRLNSSAIKLALTAQSQVSLRRTTYASMPSPYIL